MKVLRAIAFIALSVVLVYIALCVDSLINRVIPWFYLPLNGLDYLLDVITAIVFNGSVVFFGTLLISKLIPTITAGNICTMGVIIINLLWIVAIILFSPYRFLVFIFCVNIAAASLAIGIRQSKLKPIYSTWNLFPDGTAVCNNCKHKINFRENPQFICPNCKADMRKPRQ